MNFTLTQTSEIFHQTDYETSSWDSFPAGKYQYVISTDDGNIVFEIRIRCFISVSLKKYSDRYAFSDRIVRVDVIFRTLIELKTAGPKFE